jgi:FAD synthetase
MKKIVSSSNLTSLALQLKKSHEKIVLAGGCFDILHKGHLLFLKKAKEYGTKLIIFLESDINVKKLKGEGRPIHSQQERAKILSSAKDVDYIVMLSEMKNSKDYDKLINQIEPNVIAITESDTYAKEKTEQAKNVGASVVIVAKRVKGESTTRLVNLIKNKL